MVNLDLAADIAKLSDGIDRLLDEREALLKACEFAWEELAQLNRYNLPETVAVMDQLQNAIALANGKPRERK